MVSDASSCGGNTLWSSSHFFGKIGGQKKFSKTASQIKSRGVQVDAQQGGGKNATGQVKKRDAKKRKKTQKNAKKRKKTQVPKS